MPTALPHPRPRPLQRLARRALLAALPAACGLGWPLLATPASPASTRPPPNAAVRRARQQLDALEALQMAAYSAQQDADALLQALQGLAGRWQEAQDGAAPTQAALQALADQALPALAAQHARWRAATTAVDAAATAHQAATRSLLAAAPALRAAAMASLDAATIARQAAEAGELAARQALAQALAAASQAISLLGAHWQDLASATTDSAKALRQSAQAWAGLQRRWQALHSRAQAAGQASPAMPTLPQAVAPWAVPAAWAPPAAPADTSLQAWRHADRRAQQLLPLLWLQRDAQAAVQQALAGADCGAGCSAWQADADALLASLARQQAALAAARADQASAAAAVSGLPAASHQQLRALLAWRDGLAPAVATAGGPARQALQQAMHTGRSTLARLAQARAQAEAAWIAAMRRQYGDELLAFDAPSASAQASMQQQSSGATASIVAEPLLSHALHRLRARGDEPAGFGAYTYVLVGASVRPDTPGVHARLQRLLGEVRNLPVAGQIDAALRARANTFVVPTPPDSPERGDLVVDLHLAQSLLTHLPPALRLADATRRLLYAENGPFLVTLPGRLADARADWPLLFADLSKTPEVVVADVVRRYMADLIGNFNPASATWAPPAGMQVAIAMVRLVKGSGDVVQAVFPALLR